jgi:peptidyl-prolyl cis-trans isomerase D
MFDLFRSRDKLIRYMLGGVLLVVAASMVTYLIPSYNTGFSANSPVLAEIGGQQLTSAYAQQKFQQVTRGTNIPADMMDVYVPQFVEQMILQRAAVYEAQRMGLTATDDEVLAGMITSNPQFFPNGVLASKDQLEQYYAQQGQTLEEALDDMRNQLMLRKLQNMLYEVTVVPPKEVEEEYKRKHERAKVAYIAFPPAKFRDQVKITDEEARKEFERNRATYTIPEKFNYKVVVLDQSKVEATIAVSDAQLRQAYAASLDNFRQPERVHVRHILVKTEGKSDAEKKQLEAKAQDLLKQLKGGADFAELAKKVSEDPGSGQKGGDLDWLVRGQTVPEFEKAAFSLKPNELSSVVSTQFGYHIIQVLAHEQARVQPFEEVKAGLATQVRQQSVTDKMQSLADQVHAALVKTPEDAVGVAKQVGAEVVTMAKAAASEQIPTLGAAPEIQNVLPALKAGQVSDVLVLPSNRIAVVAMEGRNPARPADFDEVASQVREKLIADRTLVVAEQKAKDAAERLKKGEDINAVGKSTQLEVTTSSEFGPNDSVEGLGSAVYVADAFTQPVGAIIGPSMIQGRNVVTKVIDKKAADMVAFEGEREALLKELKQKRAIDGNDLMLDSILAKLVNEGKVRVNQAEVQRLIASYRQK